MRKIRLQVDALKVEAFATTGGGAEDRGTVRGNAQSFPDWYCQRTWNGFGCETISGEVACICDPLTRPGENTCDCVTVLDCA